MFRVHLRFGASASVWATFQHFAVQVAAASFQDPLFLEAISALEFREVFEGVGSMALTA